ncbi:hypothetical protein GC088_12960 [Arthrobacter sp. JZ12]|nr:hypothetical protein GC088_12960 [Arthrobacter sp. JZ12]
MMRIVVSRSGGFAGLTRTWSAEISTSEAEERWLPLLEHAPQEGSEDVQRDRFVYHFAVGYREVTVTESAVQGPWKELLDRVRDAASERHDEGPGSETC